MTAPPAAPPPTRSTDFFFSFFCCCVLFCTFSSLKPVPTVKTEAATQLSINDLNDFFMSYTLPIIALHAGGQSRAPRYKDEPDKMPEFRPGARLMDVPSEPSRR